MSVECERECVSVSVCVCARACVRVCVMNVMYVTYALYKWMDAN